MLNSSTQNILDVADQGLANTRIGSLCVGDEVSGGNDAGLEANLGASVRRESSPADSQFQGTTIDELLALVASKLPDISLSEQHELEEIEAEREGGDTAASGYPEPMYERNGR